MASAYGSVPKPPNTAHTGRNNGELASGATDFAQGNPTESSPLAQSVGQQSHFHEELDDSIQGSSVAEENAAMKRSTSSASTAVYNNQPSRSGTLKKKGSVRRTGSLKRSSSRRSLKAGSIKGLIFDDEHQDSNAIFHTPIPTTGSPTEVLADRFQAWRQLLKSLIAYFREVQTSYETRSKALTKLQHTASNIASPSVFATHNGLGEATRILGDYHKHSVVESNKSQDIEIDVIGALTGLRADLAQKIKEIKNLSGDFKNSVEKEKETTRREVDKLRAAIEQAEHESGGAMGKNDPFVVRLGVDRAVERQLDEENYLHRAYLNLESSGRELESIVVGEIQKAYKALAGIMRREGDDAYSVVEDLRSGPITMSKDQEWNQFVNHDPHFVSPGIPLRRIEDITYPGKDHPAAAEIRAGMLERKSKYLKSYTPGWYVLSPTHLHEFKSADKIYSQPPVMSLYLGDQRLGSHSEPSSSSHKFMLKGKQAGGMHKGHNWVFRAESHDTMLAWFNDIKTLTEGSGAERTAFVQKHARSLSNASDRRKSMSSDGFADDDADAVPYSADVASLSEQYPAEPRPQRPLPGGRFPSDIQVPRVAPLSASSEDSGREYLRTPQHEMSPVEGYQRSGANPYKLDGVPADRRSISQATFGTFDDKEALGSAQYGSTVAPVSLSSRPVHQDTETSAVPKPDHRSQGYHSQPADRSTAPESDYRSQSDQRRTAETSAAPEPINRSQNVQPSGIAVPVALGTGVAAGALGASAYQSKQDNENDTEKQNTSSRGQPTVQTTTQNDDGDIDPTVPTSSSEPANTLPTSTDPVPSTTLATAQVLSAVPHASLVAPRTESTEAVKAAPLVSQPTTEAIQDVPPIWRQNSTSAAKANLLDSQQDSTKTVEAPAPVSRQDSTPGLGGLEREGAHETGMLFPKVIRHDTDISISKLHVPGEFPRKV